MLALQSYMLAPVSAFDFESLLDSARSDITPDALDAIRAFLLLRARTVVDALPDSQLLDALAAWQREGELLFAQRRWNEAETHYRDLAELLAGRAPALAAWCAGAAAECRLEAGELLEGIADLADVLIRVESLDYRQGIDALETMISEAVERLQTSDMGLPPDLSDRV